MHFRLFSNFDYFEAGKCLKLVFLEINYATYVYVTYNLISFLKNLGNSFVNLPLSNPYGMTKEHTVSMVKQLHYNDPMV